MYPPGRTHQRPPMRAKCKLRHWDLGLLFPYSQQLTPLLGAELTHF
jgi:hypothetical protein